MSLFNSVLGSLSPSRFRDSFEDAHAQEHELPLYRDPSTSPRIPPPIASTVLWSAPTTKLSPPPRVPDDLLALQRRARHLEHQLQELLDAQADGLMSGLAGADNPRQDDSISNGSITPTVSSLRGTSISSTASASAYDDHSSSYFPVSKKKPSLNTARRQITRRIQQLAHTKADQLDVLDADLQAVHAIVEKTDQWTTKRARLAKKIQDISDASNNSASRTQQLQSEASKLEAEIRLKEEELYTMKARHRRILNEIADGQNSLEAKLSTYKTSLSLLDTEVSSFLARPPSTNQVPLTTSPFLSLAPKRRTLEMAQEYWHDEHTRLAEKCQEVDIDRAALDEGAVLWESVVRKVVAFEAELRDYMAHASRCGNGGAEKVIDKMDKMVEWLEEKLELAQGRSWNLLVCAVGAELEAFSQAKELLREALGVQSTDKGKGKGKEKLVGMDSEDESVGRGRTDGEEEVSRSVIRVGRSSPPKASVQPPKPSFYGDEDPDPELMISHQAEEDTE